MGKSALGRGLGALLGGAPPAPKPPPPTAAAVPEPASSAVPVVDLRDRVERVALNRIRSSPFQPRKDFSDDALRELADSIREQGIVQPLIVRNRGDGYELIAGERRWRAAQLVGLTEVPVIVREADDRAVLELALIENLQRENLNPIEEAQGYSQLIEQFQLTQEEAATKVGKSRAVVANAMRLLKLAPEIQAYVRDGRLSVGHAKVILGLTRAEEQKLAAEKVLKRSLNVRQTEDLIAHLQNRPAASHGGKSPPLPMKDSHIAALEQKLHERLGTRVDLRYRQGKGAVQIHFYTDDDLERVLDILGVRLD
jgi:ParB family transcriptional regulator, chromosome partitioning protein